MTNTNNSAADKERLYKVVTDMEDGSPMIKDAIEKTQQFLLVKNDKKSEIKEDEVAMEIKAYFDKTYLPNWHCVIGKNFYSSFSHEAKCYIFLYIGQIAVLIYKL